MAGTPNRRVADSRFTISRLMGPLDANNHGNVHGGVIMKMVDEAAGVVAVRHARKLVVTVAIDSMTFMEPIFLGNLVLCRAELSYVGRTSMEIRVEVTAEDPLTGTAKVTNIAYVVYVALDDSGAPTPVPGLIYDTEEERSRAGQAQERQAFRKAQRAKEILG